MSFHFADLANQIAARGAITERDTLALRQWAWADGVISAEEAAGLFSLNALGRSHAPAWVDCFVEAIIEYTMNQRSPRGYIDDANAGWLMAMIDRDGRVDTMAELELLVRLGERATDMPDRLKQFALASIEQAVLHGDGPTRHDMDAAAGLEPGVINRTEALLLRRLLFAAGGSGPGRVSADEAEMLFRIKDATLGADNAPEWQQMFVQGVANYLMAHDDFAPLTRDRAASLERFMDDRRPSLTGFFSRMNGFDWRGAIDAVRGEDEGAAIAAHDAAVADDAQVTGTEQAWLDRKVGADGTLDAMEQALLAFMAAD